MRGRRIRTAVAALVAVAAGLLVAPQPARADIVACTWQRTEFLWPGQSMCGGPRENILWSASGTYLAKMQMDGKFVLYRLAVPWRSDTGTPLWAWLGGGSGAFVTMDPDGFLDYRFSSGRIFKSAGRAAIDSFLKVQDDGKLVIYMPNNRPLMQNCGSGATAGFCQI